jgi:hypothetical protein
MIMNPGTRNDASEISGDPTKILGPEGLYKIEFNGTSATPGYPIHHPGVGYQ